MKFVIILFVSCISVSLSKTTYQLIIPESNGNPYAKLLGTIDRPLEEYTLCHWSRYMRNSSGWATLFSYSNATVVDVLRVMELNSGNCYFGDPADSLNIASGTKPVRWLHTCLTTLPNSWSIFFNGVKTGEFEKKRFLMPQDGLVVLGQDAESKEGVFGSYKFWGQIADVYMWDRALTPKGITAVYNCKNTEGANVINWNLNTWQLFNGARISAVDLPCGKN